MAFLKPVNIITRTMDKTPLTEKQAYTSAKKVANINMLHISNASKDFLLIWCKHPFGLTDELI